MALDPAYDLGLISALLRGAGWRSVVITMPLTRPQRQGLRRADKPGTTGELGGQFVVRGRRPGGRRDLTPRPQQRQISEDFVTSSPWVPCYGTVLTISSLLRETYKRTLLVLESNEGGSS